MYDPVPIFSAARIEARSYLMCLACTPLLQLTIDHPYNRLEGVLYGLAGAARELLQLRAAALSELQLACVAASLACAKAASSPTPHRAHHDTEDDDVSANAEDFGSQDDSFGNGNGCTAAISANGANPDSAEPAGPRQLCLDCGQHRRDSPSKALARSQHIEGGAAGGVKSNAKDPHCSPSQGVMCVEGFQTLQYT